MEQWLGDFKQTVDPAAPTTLEYLMKDYVAHLKHHLSQVFGEVVT